MIYLTYIILTYMINVYLPSDHQHMALENPHRGVLLAIQGTRAAIRWW